MELGLFIALALVSFAVSSIIAKMDKEEWKEWQFYKCFFFACLGNAFISLIF